MFCHSCLGAAAAFRLDRGYHGNLRGYRDEKCHLVMQSHRISSCPSLDMHDHRAATRMGLASPPPLLSARERIRRLGNARRCPPARRSYIELGFVFQNSAVIAIVMRTLYGKRCCSSKIGLGRAAGGALWRNSLAASLPMCQPHANTLCLEIPKFLLLIVGP